MALRSGVSGDGCLRNRVIFKTPRAVRSCEEVSDGYLETPFVDNMKNSRPSLQFLDVCGVSSSGEPETTEGGNSLDAHAIRNLLLRVMLFFIYVKHFASDGFLVEDQSTFV